MRLSHSADICRGKGPMAEKYNICLDIGGTKILGVIFDSN